MLAEQQVAGDTRMDEMDIFGRSVADYWQLATMNTTSRVCKATAPVPPRVDASSATADGWDSADNPTLAMTLGLNQSDCDISERWDIVLGGPDYHQTLPFQLITSHEPIMLRGAALSLSMREDLREDALGATVFPEMRYTHSIHTQRKSTFHTVVTLVHNSILLKHSKLQIGLTFGHLHDQSVPDKISLQTYLRQSMNISCEHGYLPSSHSDCKPPNLFTSTWRISTQDEQQDLDNFPELLAILPRKFADATVLQVCRI
jgi:hypothetical protein